MCILSPQRIFISPFFFYGRLDALTGNILTYFVHAFEFLFYRKYGKKSTVFLIYETSIHKHM